MSESSRNTSSVPSAAPSVANDAEKRARTVLTLAAATTAAGVAIAGTMSRATGGVIIVAAWIALVYGLHAFGRAGSSR